MDNIKILLVEDEINFGSVLSQFLKLSDFDVTWAKNGKEAWSMIRTHREFDCCVLDVMMPEMDGLTLGREIRQARPELPFVFLTAKTMKEDMIEGFEAGADDYITKPFDSELLVYKLKALVQRKGVAEPLPEMIQLGSFVFDTERRLLLRKGKEDRLSPKEAGILQHLSRNLGRVVSREKIMVDLWDEDNYFNRRSMDVYMTKLRKHLKADASIELSSLHAGGYILSVVE
ncbi:MAG: response regulator transcription factor [Flavobacteriales bacterium]|nr:response regulator transcription factor [Flavobacteriales bacterium]